MLYYCMDNRINDFVEKMEELYPKKWDFSSAQLMHICSETKTLPNNQADIYFFISLLVAQGILIKVKQGKYEFDGDQYLGLRDK